MRFKKRTSTPSHVPHSPNALLAPRLPAGRSTIVMVLMFAAFAALAARACWVQIIQHDFHVAQGEKRHRQTIALDGRRGSIVDRNDALLAISLTTYEIWADPKRIEHEAYGPLAQSLGLPLPALQERLASERARVLLKRQLDAQTADRIARMGLAGVTQVASSKRYYPEGETAAHVVGFTDIDDSGLEGIELAADTVLTGSPGARDVIRDRLGQVISDFQPPVPARDGATVRLTIDRRIQQLAYSQLKSALLQHGAHAGSAVVLDARNGEVLALANAPGFDPNERTQLGGRALRNRALTDTFEPGSTIKPLLIATALDAGIATPETLIDTAPGRYTIGRRTIHDTADHGTISVTQALTKSSNVALAKLALNLPAQTMWTKYQAYGLGHAPPLPFPGVSAGRLRPWERWRTIEQATMAYGYGISASLMQMAQAYTAFASDGVLRPATLILSDKGCPPSAQGLRVATPETAAALRTMLEATTHDDATGRAARVPGYRVGGKTGTAWKHAGPGYAKDKYRALFVGIAPIDAPRLVVAVMIDEPAHAYYGGTVAAPVFAAIAGGALRLLGVPPDA